MDQTTLKPGVLVSLKTSLRGGVDYARIDLETEHETEAGTLTAAWQTRRTIQDPDEHKAATEARGRARSTISAVCSHSSFGLLCPTSRELQLTAAIADARTIAKEHNATAKTCFLDVYVLVGRIAHDDIEAARAIRSEVKQLLDEMNDGIRAANPVQIRDAASKARQLEQMLSFDVVGKVNDAITEARKAARAIVKGIEGSAETAAAVIAEVGLAKIEAARFAFLDMDEAETEAAPNTGRAIDMGTEPESAAPMSAAPQLF